MPKMSQKPQIHGALSSNYALIYCTKLMQNQFSYQTLLVSTQIFTTKSKTFLCQCRPAFKKFALEQPMKDQMRNRGIALFFL